MKKFLFLQCFFLATFFTATAQSFSERYNLTIKGNMIVVGNSILNRGDSRPANTPFNDLKADNSQRNLEYTNVDLANTINSSSARVKNPNPASTCGLVVKKAYLYWAAAYKRDNVVGADRLTNPVLDPNKFNKVRLRQGNGSYHNITGTILHSDGSQNPTDGRSQSAYVCVADVTQYVTNINNETFTVADMQAPYGNETNGNGYAAGWTLYIIYEDVTQPARKIALFDGFAAVTKNYSQAITISGFTTVPSPLPVNAKIGFAALEGESYLGGDELKIQTNKTGGNKVKITAPGREDGLVQDGCYWNPYPIKVTCNERVKSNFFNSSITNEQGVNTDRTPSSKNMLGFDAGIFDLPNNGNTILGNDTTSASFYPTTTQDVFYPFMFAFNVEVITPNVVMEKRVYKSDGTTDITGQNNIVLGQELRYKIKFKNIGNDDAKNLVITDVLPANLQNNITGINVPSGATYTYNNRTLKVTIPNTLVKKGAPEQEISFGVKVLASCNEWRDPCSNEIKNQAFATYTGDKNPATLTPGSFSSKFSACGGEVTGPSNFIVTTDFTKCVYKPNDISLCQPTTTLSAAAGFTTYKWTKVGDASFNKTGQNLVVSEPGTYRVTKSKTGCPTMYEEYTVLENAYDEKHPIEKMIAAKQINGEVYTCTADGRKYPQVYLCGNGSSVTFDITFSNGKQYRWEKIVGNRTGDVNCPPTNTAWAPVYTDNGTQSRRTFDQQGDYRLTVTFDGGAQGDCVSTYYFRITKNNLDATAKVTDIVCTTPGKITIIGPSPTSYQFALYEGTNQVRNYQDSNEFTITNQGTYRVLIKQKAKSNIVPCVFEISGLFVKKRTPQLTVTPTSPLCYGGVATMTIQLTDAPYPPYNIVVKKDNASGAELYRSTQTNLEQLTLGNYFKAGTYYVEVQNNYGCTINKGGIKIVEPKQLKATATVLKPIMPCGAGKVRVTGIDGTKGTSYFFSDGTINNATNFTANYYDFDVTTPGTHQFAVIDKNGCRATASVAITQLTAPTTTASATVYDCGAKAKITFAVPTSATAYTYQYSVDGGTTFKTSREIEVAPGNTYNPVLQYTYNNTASCTITLPAITIQSYGANILIASAGVEKLVECGDSEGNPGKALVRFSNVQGGQEPYKYNFGDGQGWTTRKDKWLTPGTYNLSVEDAIGCSRTGLTVKVDNKIPAPVLGNTAVTYNCEGKGTVTVTTDKTNYKYTYQVNRGTPTTNNVFTNLAPGTYTITITYAQANPPAKNVLFLEDFGAGNNTGNPYINKAYYLELQDGSMPKNGNGVSQPSGNWAGKYLADGEYIVTKKQDPNNGAWKAPNDHSRTLSGAKIPNGRMFFVNIGNILGSAGAILYQRPMKDIIPNKEVKFSVALMNLLDFNDSRYPSGAPDLAIELYANQAAVTANTPLVSERIPRFRGAKNNDDWFVYEKSLNPGNNRELIAVIRSFSLETNGNDLAMDDIYLYQEPETCPTTVTRTITIAPNQGFGIDTATKKVIAPKCHNGTGEYQITIKNPQNVTYYVSKDGATFVAVPANTLFKWTGITPGTHTIKFRGELNNPSCEFTDNFTITNPAQLNAQLAANTDLSLACNPAQAQVAVTATGGTGTYQYTLLKGTTLIRTQATPNFTVTQIGSYTIRVTDANGCTKDVPFTIVQAPTLTLAATNNTANTNYCMNSATAGKVEVKVTPSSGNTQPYTFFHNGTRKVSQSGNTYTFSGLTVGTHTFTVTDKYGCTASYVTEIKKLITADGSTVAVVAKDITCDAGMAGNGKLTFKIKDGYAPYTYVVKRSNGTIAANGNLPANLTAVYETNIADTYTFEITDSKGCKVSASGTLATAAAPTATYTITKVNCYGANDGTLSVNITGGKAPYRIKLDSGAIQAVTGNQKVFTGLTPGAHILLVYGANNCSNQYSINVPGPATPLTGSAVVSELIGCSDGVNKDKAKITFVNVTGGHGGYQYKYDGNYTTNSVGFLPAGTHTVTVKDSSGCELPIKVIVPARIAPPTGTSYTIASYKCDGKATIVFTGVPTTYNYKYIINGQTFTGRTATVTNLAPGSYTVTIEYTDATVSQGTKSCPQTIQKTVIIPQGHQFKASVQSQTNISCNGGDDGKVTLKVENLYGGSYRIANINPLGQRPGVGYATPITTSTFEVGQLRAGVYTLTVAYTGPVAGNTCDIEVPVTITQPVALTLSGTITQPAMCSNGGFATVKLAANGGTPPYTYHYLIGTATQSSHSSNVFTGVKTGTAQFAVTDSKNCLAYLPLVSLPIPAPKTVSFTLEATDCYENDNQGKVTVKITNGNGGYKLSLNGATAVAPSTNSVTHTFTGLRQGSYSVTVTDAYGCQAAGSIIIRPSLNVRIKTTDQGACAGSAATIQVTATGGTGNISYAFDTPGTVTPNYGTNPLYTVPNFSGTKQIEVFVKSDRCVKKEVVTLKAFDYASFTPQTVTPTCSGTGTGKIILGNLTGASPFTIGITPPTGATRTVTGVTAAYTIENAIGGLYTITLRDALGCNSVRTVTLQDMPKLTDAELKPKSDAACNANIMYLVFPPATYNAYVNSGYSIQYSLDAGVTWHPVGSATITVSDPSFIPGKTIKIIYKATKGTIVCTTNAVETNVPNTLGTVTVTTNLPSFNNGCSVSPSGYTATVTVAAATGIQYQFSLNNEQWTTLQSSGVYVWNNLIPGRTYKFYVRNSQGCVSEAEGDVNSATGVDLPVKAHLLPTPACNGSTGSLKLTITSRASYTPGATPQYTLYKLDSPPGTPERRGTPVSAPTPFTLGATPFTHVFAGMAPNQIYYVEITEGTCKWGSRDAEIKELDPITATISNTNVINCSTPGVVEVTAKGGGGQYTYTLTSSSLVAPIAVANNRIQILREQISGHPAPVYPNSPLNITVNVSVSDQYGCSSSFGTVTLQVQPTPKVNSMPITGCISGQITLTVNPVARTTPGGDAPATEIPGYEYSRDGGLTYQASNVFGGLVPGTYDIVIKDRSSGCTATATAVVNGLLEASAEVTTPFACGSPAPNGVITVKVDNGSGSANYTYKIKNPMGVQFATGVINTAVVGSTASKTDIQIPPANGTGTYTIEVTDSGQPSTCNTTTINVVMNPAALPDIEVSTVSITCHGAANGRIAIVEKNGTNTYVITPPSGTAPGVNPIDKTAIATVGGVYTITATGANGCQTVTTVMVYEPTAITVSQTQISVTQFACATNTNNGLQAKVTVPDGAISGGVGSKTITYTAPNGNTASGNTFTYGDAAGGIITITVTDSSGCYTSTTVTIARFERLDPADITVTPGPANCNAPMQITVANSSPNVTATKLRFGIGTTPPAGHPSTWTNTTGILNVAVATTTTVWIGHSDTGCMISYPYLAPDPNTFKILAPQIKNVTCKGNNNGIATFTLADIGTNGYTITLSPMTAGASVPSPIAAGVTNFTISGLSSSTYTVTVKDNGTGCEQTYNFSITEPAVSLTATTSVRSITCAGNNGVITIENADGGWGGYKYYLSNSLAPTLTSAAWTTTNVFESLAPGTYQIGVRDSNDCMITLSPITLANPTTITGTLTITLQNCTPGTGVVEVRSVTGGAGTGYTYQLVKDGALQGTTQSTTLFSNLSAGVYNVVVTDIWGCTATLTSVTLYEPVTGLVANIVKEVTCSVPQGATISVTHQGGNSGNLNYILTSQGGGTMIQLNNPLFTGVASGTYSVSVVDLTTGCPTVTYGPFDVTKADVVTFTYTTTSVTCNGGNNGKVKVTIPGDQQQTDYIIKIEGTGGFATRSETVNTTPKDFTFEALKAGVYTVTVTSSRSCVATETIIVNEPQALVVSTTTVTTHFKCNATNDAQEAVVQVVANGGTPSYTYNFELFDGTTTTTTGFVNTTGVFSITSNGTHTQTVMAYIRDANGCTTNIISPIIIPPLKRITAVTPFKLTNISCISAETVSFTIVGGNNKGYVVAVTNTDGVASPSTQTLTAGTNVAQISFTQPANYEITITDSETGCYFTTTYFVAPYDNIDYSAAQSKPVTCKTGNDGEITLTVSGYQGTFNYRVLDATNPATVVKPSTPVAGLAGVRNVVITGLSEGSYLVELTETQLPNCTKTTTVVNVSGPANALTASTTITDLIKCGTGATGSFAVSAAGGWGNYQYRLLVGATPHAVYGTYTSTSSFEGLTANTYIVEVKDEQGCITTTTQIMAVPDPINANVTASNVLCFSDNNGVITISNTTGGSGNYTYELWEVGGSQIRGTQTETTFTGLDAREYKVKIVDGWNCDIEIPVTVYEPDEMRVTASIAKAITCHTNATISVTVTGGVPPYQYKQGAGGTPQAANTFSVGVGTYEFYVVDRNGNGCQSKVSNRLDIVRPEDLTLHFNADDAIVRCNGEATGRITFSATGGMGNNQYKLYKDSLTSPALTATATQISPTDWTFSGLYSGIYYVVASSNDCVYTSTAIKIEDRPALVVASQTTNITCFNARNGVISITVTGGTGTIKYAISSASNPRLDRFVETGYFDNLVKDTYLVRAQDEYGCYTDTTFIIDEPDQLEVKAVKTDEVCYGANDGTISLTITGGTQSYSTTIDGTNWIAGKTLYTNLAPGDYTIMVRDAHSCTTEAIVTIGAGVQLQETATVEYTCPGNNVSNAIRVSVAADHLAQTTFALDGGTPQSSGYFTQTAAGTPILAGVHTITVRNINGCTKTLTVNVESFAPLSVVASKTDITCYGKNDGKVKLTVTGATNSYTYTISPQAGQFDEATTEYTELPKGQYTIKVMAIGNPACELSQTINIIEPDLLIAKAETVTETCYGQNDGQMRFVIEGGRAPYNYNLKKPDGTTYATATNVATGAIVSYTGLVPGRYNLEYNDGNCSQTLEIEVASAPSIAPEDVKLGFNCSTESTTYTTSYLNVTFPESARGKLSSTTTSYSLDGGITIKPFVSFDGVIGKTSNIEQGVYSLTIHYKGEGMSNVCSQVWNGTVSTTRYPGLEILDKTDPREINKVRVKVVGGNPRPGDTPYSVTFNGVFDGTYEYMLKPTDPTSRVVNGRIYKLVVVEATDENGCKSTLTIEKEYMKSVPPDFFTPNGDGENDGWDPDKFRSYPNLTVDIYDRYGRYITTLKSGQVWDGRYNGREMPSGDYWYILRTHEEEGDQQYMGHFTLYR